MTTAKPPKTLTVKEVASFLRMDPHTVYRAIERGRIPAFKVGGAWRLKVEEIEAWTRSENNRS